MTDTFGLWGKLSFAWANKPIYQARKKRLELEELYLPQDSEAAKCYDEFAAAWEARAEAEDRDGRRKSPLFSALWSLYGREFMIAGIYKLGWSLFVIAGAYYFVRSLLLHVDEKKQGTGHRYEEVCALLTCSYERFMCHGRFHDVPLPVLMVNCMCTVFVDSRGCNV